MTKTIFQRINQAMLKKDFDLAAQREAELKAYGSAKSKPFAKNGKPQMWVVMADLHAPEHDRPSVAAIFDFIQHNKKQIHGLILLGDQLNCSSISRHTEGLPGLRESGGFQKEIDIFDHEIMTPIDAMLPKATKVFLGGNHDWGWLDLYLEKQPELKGALSWPKLLNLKERGWIAVPQGEVFNIGPLVCLHGDQVGSGANIAKKIVDSYCSSTISGHAHTFAAATKTSEVKQKDRWVSIVLPCLTTLSPSYGKSRPNQHLRGFGIVENFQGGRLFNVYVPIISDGMFCFGGQVYGQ